MNINMDAALEMENCLDLIASIPDKSRMIANATKKHFVQQRTKMGISVRRQTTVAL